MTIHHYAQVNRHFAQDEVESFGIIIILRYSYGRCR